MFQKKRREKWRRNSQKKYKTFPRSEARHNSAKYDKLSKIRARYIIMKFQNTKYKEIIKRLRGGRGINRLPIKE